MRMYNQGNIDQYPVSQGAKEYVILNDFHCINIYLTINMKRSAKKTEVYYARWYCRFKQQLVKKLQP